jgi:hypothetical protein
MVKVTKAGRVAYGHNEYIVTENGIRIGSVVGGGERFSGASDWWSWTAGTARGRYCSTRAEAVAAVVKAAAR